MSNKVISRTLHLLSSGLLSGLVTLNYFFGTNEYLREEPQYGALHVIVGLVVFVTGILNIFLVKGKKNLEPEHKLWLHLFELKFFLSLLLTPAIKPLEYLLDLSEESKSAFQFYVLCVVVVMSVGAKAYREDSLNNF